jgi:hypothetical protein
VVASAVLAVAPPTGAALRPQRSVSGNWAGYAVTGKGAAPAPFTHVSAAWVEPRIACAGGGPAFSVLWVGLGGFVGGDGGLEQIGTEADCTPSGRPTHGAWFELLPAGPVRLGLRIRPGDRIRAAIDVHGPRVALRLENRTTRAVSTRVVRMAAPGLSSAEWIVEAPSSCGGGDGCRTLPLANFGTASFSRAAAVAGRHTGSILDDAWSATAIELGAGDPAAVYFAARPWQRQGTVSGASRAGATPAPPTANGASFTVTWRGHTTLRPEPNPTGPYAP